MSLVKEKCVENAIKVTKSSRKGKVGDRSLEKTNEFISICNIN